MFSVLLAGAGIKRGFAFGASDATATEPQSDPLSVEDLAATVYHQIGIDPDKILQAPGPRPIAIGTGGRSPALAARLRERFDDEIGEEFGALVEILGAVRQRLDGRPDRHEVLRTLARSELPALLRARDLPAVDRLLAAAAGADCSLAHLGIVPGTGG